MECSDDNKTVEFLASAKFIKKELMVTCPLSSLIAIYLVVLLFRVTANALQTLKKFLMDLEKKKMANHLGALQVQYEWP
jgi:hypothetical protein